MQASSEYLLLIVLDKNILYITCPLVRNHLLSKSFPDSRLKKKKKNVIASRVAQDEGHVTPHQLYRVRPCKKRLKIFCPTRT